MAGGRETPVSAGEEELAVGASSEVKASEGEWEEVEVKVSAAGGTKEGPGGSPEVSKRIQATDVPCIVQMQEMLRGTDGVLSLAQGIVHWRPPQAALEAVQSEVFSARVSGYGPDDGLPELRAALTAKIRIENNLTSSSVMVTAGANQAFVNVVLALCDAENPVVLFVPYYFNHVMAFQMTGTNNVILGRCHPDTLYPDTVWLESVLTGGQEGAAALKPKLVVVVTPNNPTGTVVPEDVLKRISSLCQRSGTWLVVDNTYEYFVYDKHRHSCVEGPHVINIFSFSKAYGMMGWRIGYIAYPASVPGLGAQLLKAQDTIPICPPTISQRLAVATLQEGGGAAFAQEQIAALGSNRSMALAALEPLGEGAVKGGEGAIYLWAQLPAHAADDREVVRWLVANHRVCVIPGSACGMPGFIRVAFANQPPNKCILATDRLREGLAELVKGGLSN